MNTKPSFNSRFPKQAGFPAWLAIVLVVVAIVAAVLSAINPPTAQAETITATKAHVSTNAPVLHRFNTCVPYARAMTIYTGGYSHNGVLQHGDCSVKFVKTEETHREVVHTPVIVDDNNGGEIVPGTGTDDTDDTDEVVDPETPVIIDDGGVQVDECTNANPGNTKCKGKAGEDPNGKGTMDNDNAGGNGNGEHGNQGVGGNSNGDQNSNAGGNSQNNGGSQAETHANTDHSNNGNHNGQNK